MLEHFNIEIIIESVVLSLMIISICLAGLAIFLIKKLDKEDELKYELEKKHIRDLLNVLGKCTTDSEKIRIFIKKIDAVDKK